MIGIPPIGVLVVSLLYIAINNIDLRETSMCDSRKKECELGNCCVQNLQRHTNKFNKNAGNSRDHFIIRGCCSMLPPIAVQLNKRNSILLFPV